MAEIINMTMFAFLVIASAIGLAIGIAFTLFAAIYLFVDLPMQIYHSLTAIFEKE